MSEEIKEKSSKDLKVADANMAIAAMSQPDEIIAFMDGDVRKGVIVFAEARLTELGHVFTKQGKVQKPITMEDVQEFKGDPVMKKTSVITMRDGKPRRVCFENGREVSSEEPGGE